MNPPPIQWIPVFEAAARHKSFRKAAEELHVSPPAISQQIKSLEIYLGIPLFTRHGPRLELTDAGDFYYQNVKKTVHSHVQGFKEFDRKYNRRSLRLNTPLFIAQEILIPNYLSFKQYEPNTELRITTGTEYIDFEAGTADLAIRFGSGKWEGLNTKLLCATKVAPVCSPAYLEDASPEPSEVIEWLNHQTLLSTKEDFSDWKSYLPNLQIKDGIVCDSYFSAIKSAEQGLGVAVGVFPAVNSWVNDERLALLSNLIDIPSGYWLVYPNGNAQNELIDSCFNWSKQLFDALPLLKNSTSNGRKQ